MRQLASMIPRPRWKTRRSPATCSPMTQTSTALPRPSRSSSWQVAPVPSLPGRARKPQETDRPRPVAPSALTDGSLTSTATLTLTITPVNDAPIGVNDSATTLEDTPVSGNVLTNDTDVDGPSKTVTQFVVGGTTFAAGTTASLAGVGALVINADGSYTFTPAANYHGAVPVATYTLTDGSLNSTTTLV